ncbi:MAG: CPBP family intramembrane metalloprotease [Planctomycetes bacterium]|nr:CPBP family intramembrane metalloprotease [Planctomycetota bacterium]
MNEAASCRRAALELGAVMLTGALHLLFEEVLHAKGPFIALALVGWSAYLGLALRRHRGQLAQWGLRLDGLARDSRWPGLVLVCGAGALVAVGACRGTLRLSWHMAPLLVLYPIWGLAQQFLVQAMVARNLRLWIASPVVVTLIAAALFGASHWPDRFLMAATFALALLFTPLYLRRRSLLPLGVAHGWLGVLAYYWLLGRDPWLELVG